MYTKYFCLQKLSSIPAHFPDRGVFSSAHTLCLFVLLPAPPSLLYTNSVLLFYIEPRPPAAPPVAASVTCSPVPALVANRQPVLVSGFLLTFINAENLWELAI